MKTQVAAMGGVYQKSSDFGWFVEIFYTPATRTLP